MPPRQSHAQASEALHAFAAFLRSVQGAGFGPEQRRPLPLPLVDFASAFVASLVAADGAGDTYAVLCNFIRRILRRGELSYATVLLAVLYLQRLRDVRRRWPNEAFCLAPDDRTGCAEFLTAVMLADKYLYDTAYANMFWAGANGRYTLAELNEFEWRFLDRLEFDLYVSDDAFRDFIGYLEMTVALRQAAGRGAAAALTYADLTAMSATLPDHYARELRLTLPPASALALAAKVLLGTAAVYSSIVVCLVVAASLSSAAAPRAALVPAPVADFVAAAAAAAVAAGSTDGAAAACPPGAARCTERARLAIPEAAR